MASGPVPGVQNSPPGGRGAWDFRPGECIPRNLFLFFIFCFCNSLTLNVLVLFMYHFALLSIDKILI